MNDRFDALIVDFGGVLTTPLQASMSQFAKAIGIELQDLVRVALAAYSGGHDELVVGFERGELTEEAFGHALAQRLTEASGKTVAGEGLVDRLFGTLRAEEAMFDAVGAVKGAGYKTALLSNSWGLSVYPRERFDDLLDVVVISGEVGLRKPDPAIYTLATDQLDVEPSRCIFVDDHPGHLKPASAAGMTTVLHRSPVETIAKLEELLSLRLSF